MSTASALTVGTAGHIDHGKTALVKALTGTDTDRLPAERARGISIELGFAQLELDGGRRLSVVDVPGHERFVRTMIAGATGIDLFLLVVDAREGPRAQTREHLEILRLLGIDRGVVALTKIDAATPDQVAETAVLLRELLPATELVPVSAHSGEGLLDLARALGRVASTIERVVRFGPARLYVDRVFSLPGAGTVATGTLWSGTVRAGDRLQILPGDFEVRVRSVQVHGDDTEEAAAGQRVALSLVKENRRRVARGAALVQPGAYPSSYRLDVALDERSAVAHGARVLVCHGTSSLSARVLRIGERYAQLRLERPLVAARGDRLVLRQETTVGGAFVLDPDPPRDLDRRRLQLLDVSSPQELLAGVVSEPVRLDALRARGLLAGADLEEGLGALGRAGDWIFAPAWLAGLRTRAAAALEARAAELDPGLPAGALLGDVPWTGAILPLLGLESRDGKVYLPGARTSTRSRGEEAEALERRLAESGLEPVRVDDRDLAMQLEREGRLVRVGDGLAVGVEVYARARELVREECGRDGTISLARFRDLLGSSRRVAQLLLERLDSDRVTLRVGDERRLRRSAAAR